MSVASRRSRLIGVARCELRSSRCARAQRGHWAPWALATLLIATPVHAQDENNEESGGFLRTAGTILAIEGGAAMVSGVAILDPQIYGGALTFAALWTPDSNRPAGGTLMLGIAGLGIYNIVELDKDDDTDREIFRNN
jgi:hypothetical protein